MKLSTLKIAVLNAAATALYIFGVVSLINYISTKLSEKPDTIFAPITMLLLFVFSATVTSTLVLGRPFLWYTEGKKRDAITLLLTTIAALFVLLLGVVITLFVNAGAQ